MRQIISRKRPLNAGWLSVEIIHPVVALLLVFLCSFATGAPAETGEKHVVIVRHSVGESSSRLIKGFKSHFARHSLANKLTIVTANSSDLPDSLLPDSLRSLGPDLIITIGSNLTRIVRQSITDIPIVFGAVFQPEISGFVSSRKRPGGNVTGASLDISLRQQFKYFKQVYPDLKRVGVIHSEEMSELIKRAKKAAAAAGLELRAAPVSAGGPGGAELAVYAALDSLLENVDGLWSLADPLVFSRINTRLILSRTLKERVPFMGFSSTLVASGALFALDFDYKDIGRQVGELAEKVLSGSSPASLSVTRPGVIWFHYNENTSRQVSVAIPDELKLVAKKVFK
ncbi:MAG: ABC transporter substrate-binding protein [Candidatus Zixiibacteriota bacterium]